MTKDIFTNITTGVNKYITLKAPTGFEVKYSIRLKRFLLIQTNFNPLNFDVLIHRHLISAKGIERVDSVGTYDDGTGYIIYFLTEKVDTEILYNEIQSIFKSYFIDKQHENN